MTTAIQTEPTPPSQGGNKGVKPAAHERTCLVTGAVCSQDNLIRFALSPDNIIVPDLAQKLPGRGFWVTAERHAIAEAAKKNPFSRAAKEKVKVDPDLADSVYRLSRRRLLDMLGLAKRAGLATLGQPQVEAVLKAGKLSCLFVAADAGRDQEKLSLENRNIHVNREFSRDELGAALGYDQIVYLGLSPDRMTHKIVAMCGQMAALAPLPVTAQTDSQKQ